MLFSLICLDNEQSLEKRLSNRVFVTSMYCILMWNRGEHHPVSLDVTRGASKGKHAVAQPPRTRVPFI